MSTIVGQFLSDEAISSARASLASLDTLQQSIVTAAEQSDVINADQGTQAAFQIVHNLRGMFGATDDLENDKPLHEGVVHVLTHDVFPSLAVAVTELQQLWESIVSAVNEGSDGMPLVEEFMTMCDNEDSAAFRIQMGIGAIQGMALSEAADAMLGFF